MTTESISITSLEDIWPLQAALNAKAGIDTQELGDKLVADEADSESLLAAGRALKNYIDAMMSECAELQDCMSWKHWYKEAKQGRQYQLQDLQNARVEVTDMLFFWISMCQILGVAPQDIYRLYEKKLGINHKRQDENRTQAQHGTHEDENRNVV
ncbi:MAG: dUTP diphosphatase [Phycisphaerae bacterium]|nr:dUTP diphosphatase [Phycisphaerae bacterium]